MRELNIKNIDEQIDEQLKKENKLKEGLDVSKTESLISSELENDDLQKTLNQLNKKKKNNFLKKGTIVLDNLNENKLKEKKYYMI